MMRSGPWTFALITMAAAPPVVAQCEPEEVQKLLASDGASDDRFGHAVSMRDDVAIIGAWLDDDPGEDSGSAYVFRYADGAWGLEEKLEISDGEALEHFGDSVAIDGDVALVGAHYDDDQGDRAGSVYVFRFNGVTWEQEQKLLASDGEALDTFGESISIDGEIAVVGAPGNSDQGYRTGSAYVFRFNGKVWLEEEKLVASDGAQYDAFGDSLSISDGTVAVGSEGDDDLGPQSGAVYVFRLENAIWMETQKLTASDGEEMDGFGGSVAVAGNSLIIGAYGDDDAGTTAGSAYFFRFNGSSWVEEHKVTASDAAPHSLFGEEVAIDGNAAMVGVWRHGAGAAYVFRRNGTLWEEQAKLIPTNRNNYDAFGTSVSVDRGIAVVGAALDNDLGDDSGSAFIFDLNCHFDCPLTNYTVNRGTRTGGNLLSMMNSDAYSLKIASEPGTVYHISEITVKATSPVDLPSRLDLRTETRANANVVQTRLSLRNVNTNAWDQVAAFAQPQSDLVKILEDIPNPEDYVRESDGLIRIRVQMIRALSRGPFTMFVDHVQVTVYE